MTDEGRQSRSLLERHYNILGVDETPLGQDPGTLREARWLDGLPFPELALEAEPSQGYQLRPPRRFGPRSVAAFALAAAIALALLWPARHQLPWQKDDAFTDDLSPKGLAVWVYAEHLGAVGQWHPGQRLADGDRVRVQLATPFAGWAYAVIVNRDGAPLTSLDDALAGALLLQAGGRAVFGGSSQLTGPNEGETLVVLAPGEAHASAVNTAAELAELLRLVARNGGERGKVGGLLYFRYQLR